MAGHLLFNSGSNESSLAPQFKWLDNTFKFAKLLVKYRVGKMGKRPAKIPSLLTDGISAYLMQKNAVGGSTNIPLTTEGIIRRI